MQEPPIFTHTHTQPRIQEQDARTAFLASLAQKSGTKLKAKRRRSNLQGFSSGSSRLTLCRIEKRKGYYLDLFMVSKLCVRGATYDNGRGRCGKGEPRGGKLADDDDGIKNLQRKMVYRNMTTKEM